MTDHSKAIFLSYASQDAAAARRIHDVLRAAGLEVWLDQSELRGGDAWDASIRRQIRECALFVPIISANTQSRTEGYFRLEWRLAEQRSHLMARGRPFLVPIVIDDTPEAGCPRARRLPRGAVDAAARRPVRRGVRGAHPAVADPAKSTSANARVGAERQPATPATAGGRVALAVGYSRDVRGSSRSRRRSCW